MPAWKVAIIGAGKIGETIASFLHSSDAYDVVLTDSTEAALDRVELPIEKKVIDASNATSLVDGLRGVDAVLSAAPFFLTPTIAAAAKEIGAHYFDLTEDVASTEAVRKLAEGSKSVFIPQCGLAPGFVGIAGAHLAHEFDKIEKLVLRVGALPLFPTNALKYNMTWSTDGLINEYCNPCDAIVDGTPAKVQPLEGAEIISIDGTDYECFNTSGGLGTLCETLDGKASYVAYKTVRYPGHLSIIKMLLHDLGLIERRDLLGEVFDTALPRTEQDVVIVFCTATGWKNGTYMERSYLNKSLAQKIGGKRRSAIQITTAAGICANLELVRTGILPNQGFLSQEDVPFEMFLETEFGQYYRMGDVKDAA
ncbi:MAG: saccharopine dehydrogenase C-terminal domain-containing protein [Pseudomonadota bacterium]